MKTDQEKSLLKLSSHRLPWCLQRKKQKRACTFLFLQPLKYIDLETGIKSILSCTQRQNSLHILRQKINNSSNFVFFRSLDYPVPENWNLTLGDSWVLAGFHRSNGEKNQPTAYPSPITKDTRLEKGAPHSLSAGWERLMFQTFRGRRP